MAWRTITSLEADDRGLNGADRFFAQLRAKFVQQPALFLDSAAAAASEAMVWICSPRPTISCARGAAAVGGLASLEFAVPTRSLLARRRDHLLLFAASLLSVRGLCRGCSGASGARSGNQSTGGDGTPQTFPAISSSTAIWNTGPCRRAFAPISRAPCSSSPPIRHSGLLDIQEHGLTLNHFMLGLVGAAVATDRLGGNLLLVRLAHGSHSLNDQRDGLSDAGTAALMRV